MECEIREAQEEDAADVSLVIISALRSSNAQAYSKEIIERVEKSFSPSAVSEIIGRRTAFVALNTQTRSSGRSGIHYHLLV